MKRMLYSLQPTGAREGSTGRFEVLRLGLGKARRGKRALEARTAPLPFLPIARYSQSSTATCPEMASLHPTIAFALCVLPLLRASPLPAVTPLARLNARQFTATTTTAPLESMTSTTTDSASSSASTQERSTWRGAVSARGDQARSESSPMLSAVTIGLICAVIVILILAR